MENLFSNLPNSPLEQELVQSILNHSHVRIERIVSTGQASPPGFWYDQDESEWVVLLQGEAVVEFQEPKRLVTLRPGDILNIAPHCRHRVHWTKPDAPSVWLAVFHRQT